MRHANVLDQFIKTVDHSADLNSYNVSWALDSAAGPVAAPRFLSAPLLGNETRSGHAETWLWLGRPREDHPPTGDPRQALASLLSEDEMDRADRLRFAADRWSYCAAHAGLRVLLAQALEAHPRDVTFAVSPGGKPALDPARHGSAACAELHFNISHTRGMVAVALSRRPVGIDVEPVRPLPDMRNLVATLMAPEALAAFDAAEDDAVRIELFFRYWTLGEAFIKATGLGLDQGLDSFAFTPAGEPRLIRVTPGWGPARRWSLGHVRAAARSTSP